MATTLDIPLLDELCALELLGLREAADRKLWISAHRFGPTRGVRVFAPCVLAQVDELEPLELLVFGLRFSAYGTTLNRRTTADFLGIPADQVKAAEYSAHARLALPWEVQL